VGTHGPEPVDYPTFAARVAAQVVARRDDLGILVCGSGIGVCIAANKVPGIRAAYVTDTYSAKMSRAHNDANVLCLGARVTGPELMKHFRAQAVRFGTAVVTADVTKIDFSKRPFQSWVDDDLYTSDAVIVTTGATAKYLDIPSEKPLMGRGVSACAVCDGAIPFYRNKVLGVVGGGDTAMEEAMYLTKFASEVVVIHRRDQFRASKVMAGRVQFCFSPILVAMGQVKAGRVLALAVSTAARSPMFPDVPTVAEAAIPGFEYDQWYGLLVAAKTPRPLVNTLNKEIVRVLALPDIKERLLTQGATPAPSTPTTCWRSCWRRWRRRPPAPPRRSPARSPRRHRWPATSTDRST